MNRPCHKGNVYSLTDRESPKADKFAEVELTEAKAIRLLKLISSPGEFEVVKKSARSFAKCLTCGPLCGDITLLPKGNDFETSINNHLKSKTHQMAKKQSKISSFLPKNTSHTSMKEKNA